MFTEEVLKHLSYACGCPLDIKRSLGIVNGMCPNHPKNILLFDGMPIEAYRAYLKTKFKEKVANKPSEIV